MPEPDLHYQRSESLHWIFRQFLECFQQVGAFRQVFGNVDSLHEATHLIACVYVSVTRMGQDQAAYLGFKNLKKEAYLRAQNSQKLRPKKWLNKAFSFLANFF